MKLNDKLMKLVSCSGNTTLASDYTKLTTSDRAAHN